MVAQALTDYRDLAVTIWREETDHPQDIAEDVLREAIDATGLSEMHERLYGKVDLKKARSAAFSPLQVSAYRSSKRSRRHAGAGSWST